MFKKTALAQSMRRNTKQKLCVGRATFFHSHGPLGALLYFCPLRSGSSIDVEALMSFGVASRPLRTPTGDRRSATSIKLSSYGGAVKSTTITHGMLEKPAHTTVQRPYRCIFSPRVPVSSKQSRVMSEKRPPQALS